MISGLIHLVIILLILGLVIWLLLWLVDYIPLPEPFGRIARAVIVVVGVLIVILLLLQFVGVDSEFPRLR
jgi:uncharacterized protein YhhL (DUF1145 family)